MRAECNENGVEEAGGRRRGDEEGLRKEGAGAGRRLRVGRRLRLGEGVVGSVLVATLGSVHGTFRVRAKLGLGLG